ncbi:hypothetical protein MBLNU457_1739t1 [Dothideomycetes sp. NU457]
MAFQVQDTISIHPEPPASPNESVDHLLIFHITGNPGLASYYTTFLTLLYSQLQDLSVPKTGKRRPIQTHIYSPSLAGFEVNTRPPESLARLRGAPPYNLVAQIDHIDLAIGRAVDEVEALKRPNSAIKVVLTGHSVGTFILLEVLRRRMERAQKGHPGNVEIIGAILLFPTIMDLAKSPRGRKFWWLLVVPRSVLVLAAVAKLLTFWIPFSWMLALIQTLLGMPSEAATTTAAFVKSAMGVTQALYLAKNELDVITTDMWDDEVWGVEKAKGKSKRPKMFFYFGENDHWVADKTRDDLIAARASKEVVGDEDKPVMEIDKQGVGHDFCIRQSEPVARKVAEYVQQTVQTNWR